MRVFARTLAAVFGADSPYAMKPQVFLISLGVLLLWAFWIVLSRWALTVHMHPGDVILLRYAAASLVCLPLLFRISKAEYAALPWGKLAVMIPCYGVIFFLLFFIGLKHTSVAKAGVLLNGLSPVANAIVAWLIYRTGIGWRKWLGLVILVIANAFLLFSGMMQDSINTSWLFIIGGTFVLAVYMTLLGRNPINILTLLPLLAWGNLLLFLPFYPFLESNLAAVPWDVIIFQAFFQGIVIQVMLAGLMAYTMINLGSVAAMAIYGFVPLIAGVLGWLLLGEALFFAEIIGLIFCTVGILVFTRSR